MNRVNYQKELDRIISDLEVSKEVPRLLLHSCCAPCSSYVLEYLSRYFSITLFYYNPNIGLREEYELRVAEQKKLIEELPALHKITFVEGRYEPEAFYEAVKGLEREPEGAARCRICFRQRLNEAARIAAEGNFDYFTTTLSISPLKNAQVLAEESLKAEERFGVRWLPSDFKKKEGYKRSVELSRLYGLYRQEYCGCVFSRGKNQSSDQ